MKRGQGVHTVPAKGGGWKNSVSGEDRVVHPTKKEAVLHGRYIARLLQLEHTIHRRDGVISAKNSYGNDPYPPRDGR